MTHSIFADESGTDPSMKCFTIGALVIPNEKLAQFEKWFYALKSKHGVGSELKWTRIANSHGAINFGIELLDGLLKTKSRMGFIVVKKSDYRNWKDNEEDAFYTTYTMLIHDMLKLSNLPHDIFIDDKEDSYPKQDEAMQVIVNNMLKKMQSRSILKTVNKSDSKHVAGIQAIDLLTGAINASHNMHLDSGWSMHKGKHLLITKFASIPHSWTLKGAFRI